MKKFLMVVTAIVALVFLNPLAHSQTPAPAPTQTPAPDQGVTGKWHFVLDTPGGPRENDSQFTVDKDGNVTGKFGDTDVAGTFKGGELNLNFDFTSEEAGATAPMKILGKIDETGALTGTWEFSEYNGTFKATRPAPDPAPAPAPAAK